MEMRIEKRYVDLIKNGKKKFYFFLLKEENKFKYSKKVMKIDGEYYIFQYYMFDYDMEELIGTLGLKNIDKRTLIDIVNSNWLSKNWKGKDEVYVAYEIIKTEIVDVTITEKYDWTTKEEE